MLLTIGTITGSDTYRRPVPLHDRHALLPRHVGQTPPIIPPVLPEPSHRGQRPLPLQVVQPLNLTPLSEPTEAQHHSSRTLRPCRHSPATQLQRRPNRTTLRDTLATVCKLDVATPPHRAARSKRALLAPRHHPPVAVLPEPNVGRSRQQRTKPVEIWHHRRVDRRQIRWLSR